MLSRLVLLTAIASLAAAVPAQATVITFEDLGVAPGTSLDTADGVGVTSFGFDYTPGPVFYDYPTAIGTTVSFNDLHMVNGYSGDPWNGTTNGLTHDDVVLTKSGGGTFSLQAFDFAGSICQNTCTSEPNFTVIGHYIGGGAITTVLTPDGIPYDGLGGNQDFQTFTLGGPSWTNLVSVQWVYTGLGTNYGYFSLDNIVVDAPVPEPASLLLLTTGLAGLAARRRMKKRT